MVEVKLSNSLVKDAKLCAQVMNRSTAEQIEYWARLGKAAESNPDLPIDMLQDLLVSLQEVKTGKLKAYRFGH